MGTYHKQQLKKLFGHPDFGPVLADDNLSSSPAGVQAVAGHALAQSWIAPRDTQVKGIVAMATGVLDGGSLEYAVTCSGVVMASGTLIVGQRSTATFVPTARQLAQICPSGSLIEIVYAVSADLGSAQTVRLAVPVCYLGKA